jgi:DegV family protein with EDD domain
MINTLDNLHRGGRISLITAALGSALQIKPLLSVEHSQVLVWGRVRSRERALQQLADRVRSWAPLAEMAVLHTGDEALARRMIDRLHDLLPAGQVILTPAGSALTAHLGLGAVGVCALARAAE